MPGPSIDAAATEVARELLALGGNRRSPVVGSWWSERMLEWAMSHPSFKTQLFRFVDVFPATHGDADIVRHLEEHLGGPETPRTIDVGIGLAGHAPFGKSAAAAVARRSISGIARQFIVGASSAEVIEGLNQLWTQGSAFTVDLLGEKTVTEAEADAYADRVTRLLDDLATATRTWPASPSLESDDLGSLPRVNVSVKPSALASRYAPLSADEGIAQAAVRLRPILRRARDAGAFVHFDAEHYDVKDLTLRLLRDLLSEEEFADLNVGIVVQAYLHDSADDLAHLIEFSASRSKPLTVRLVKGAYWDTETVVARAEGWPSPVFDTKAETDANYERCSRLLHDHHGQVRAAFASHNLRSLGHAVAYARSLGIPDNGYEVQLLFGMAPPLHDAVRAMGLRLRVYCPAGELVPGMAYLVRRLLENTANESFVRRSFVEGGDVEALLGAPGLGPAPDPDPGPSTDPDTRPPTDRAESSPPLDRHQALAQRRNPRRRPLSETESYDGDDPGPAGGSATPLYHHEALTEWRRPSQRKAFAAHVERTEATIGAGPIPVPAVIEGRRIMTEARIPSVDPARPSVLVGESASCGAREADEALAAARRAQPGWAARPAAERASVLRRAAAWMRERRHELAALEIFEAGKPWRDADADVCEAIDFLEYYARQALRLDRGGEVESPPGERNSLSYEARGVAVAISPWNFPLAIPTGMVAAALVTGNAVMFKPAEQTPVTAFRLVEALEAGGLPPGVLAFLPGRGEDVGAYLVAHPEVSTIAFTGSLAVGQSIIESAAVARPGQRHVKRVVAEMGGKNAIVVDEDADLDQAVPIVLASAFGYAGQKCSACSRLIVVRSVHDELVERLVGAARVLGVGHPRYPEVDVGPLIDSDAFDRVRSYVELSPREGRVVLAGQVGAEGWFVGPTIVDDVDPKGRLASEEIFGPVLVVMAAHDLDEALTLANDTGYALTAGIVSRSPSNIARAVRELRAGNVYVNRNITGAVVGRHPFGGTGLSGVGFKAGGPDYLLQFTNARAVSENTLRQGFAPQAGE